MLSADFLAKTLQPEGSSVIHSKCWKEKAYNQEYYALQGYRLAFTEREGFSDITWEFITTKVFLQEMLNVLF